MRLDEILSRSAMLKLKRLGIRMDKPAEKLQQTDQPQDQGQLQQQGGVAPLQPSLMSGQPVQPTLQPSSGNLFFGST
jgi:hypothetical protein